MLVEPWADVPVDDVPVEESDRLGCDDVDGIKFLEREPELWAAAGHPAPMVVGPL